SKAMGSWDRAIKSSLTTSSISRNDISSSTFFAWYVSKRPEEFLFFWRQTLRVRFIYSSACSYGLLHKPAALYASPPVFPDPGIPTQRRKQNSHHRVGLRRRASGTLHGNAHRKIRGGARRPGKVIRRIP